MHRFLKDRFISFTWTVDWTKILKRVFPFFFCFVSLAQAQDDIGLNFRATAAYVTDVGTETYARCNSDAYPTTRGGFTFGRETASFDTERDRESTIDRRLAGVCQRENNVSKVTYRIDLPSTGDYDVTIGVGDYWHARVNFIDFKDTNSVLWSIAGTATAANQFLDANNNLRTSAANWASNITKRRITMTTTIFRVDVGQNGADGATSGIAHIRLERVATSPSIAEVCGSGIGTAAKVSGSCPAGYAEANDDTTRCFLLCPSSDGDDDGFIANDCDNTDRMIYPGQSTIKGCAGGQFRTCQSSGAYTSCSSAAFTAATGSGTNYYVDAGSGSDSNACTSGSPCQNLFKFSGGYGGAPASPISLNAGDAVIIVGTTNFTNQHAFTGITANFANARSGTLANPIRIVRDPRSTAVLASTANTPIYVVYPSEHWVIDSLLINGGNSAKTGIRFNGVKNSEIRNNFIYNLRGSGSDNDTAISHPVIDDGTGIGSVNIHHNLLKDNRWDGTVSRANVRDIMVIGKITAGSTSLVNVTRNVSWESNYSASLSSVAFGRKHGNSLATSGGAKMNWDNNIAINKNVGMDNNGAFQNFFNNRFIDVNTGFEYLSQDNDTFQDTDIYDNTVRGNTFVHWNNRSGAAADEIDIRNNVFTSSKASYASGDGVYTILNGGTSGDETTVKAENMFISNNNCYFNSATSPRYGWFQSGAHGGLYPFAAWRTDSAQDASSFEENPSLNTFLVPQSANCATRGWRFPASTGGGAPPSFTPIQNTWSSLGGVVPRRVW